MANSLSTHVRSEVLAIPTVLITYADNDMLMGGGVEQSCATHVSGGTGWSALQ